MAITKEFLKAAVTSSEEMRERALSVMWNLLNNQEDGWEIIQLAADDFMIGENGKINSQAKSYKALRTLVQTASVLVEKDGELVRDKDAAKLTIGRAKDPKTGKLTNYNEVRESGTSRGRNAGAGAEKNADADAEPELKLVPLMMSLVDKFGYENVQNVLRGLKPDEELKEAA